MYNIECTLKGIVPMMHDRFFNANELETGTKKKAKNTWKKELDHQIYKDENGVFVPADNIRMMLIGNKFRKGAAYIQGTYIEKKKGTEYTNFCKGCVWVIGLDDPLKVYVHPIRKTYDDYDERSFINASGSRSIKRRPLVNLPWALNFMIQVTDNQMDQSKIRELFDVAGLRCGVGAYGPTFGRCLVTKWETMEQARISCE